MSLKKKMFKTILKIGDSPLQHDYAFIYQNYLEK